MVNDEHPIVAYAEDALSVPLQPWQVAYLSHAQCLAVTLTERLLPRS